MGPVERVVQFLGQLRAERVHVELALPAPVEHPLDRFATHVADPAGFCRARLPHDEREGVGVHEGGEGPGARAAVVVQVEVARVAPVPFPDPEGLATVA